MVFVGNIIYSRYSKGLNNIFFNHAVHDTLVYSRIDNAMYAFYQCFVY